MPKAVICCKASISDGMGHIYRQLNLANELKKQGWKISFYVPQFKPADDLLTKSGYPPTLYHPKTSISGYVNEPFDIAILDMQDTTESLVFSIKKFAPRIVSFEDLGSGRNHVDILIDSNLAKSKSKDLSSNIKTLFGTDYSVLNPNFADYHMRPRLFNPSLKTVLITMGATDPKGLTLPLTQLILKEKNELKLTVLPGHNATNAHQLDKLKSQFKSLSVTKNESNMAKVLWEHEVVICAGGITLHEAMAVGTPAFIINQVEHQQTKARSIERSGAAINLGLGSNFDKEKLHKALDWNKIKLESMSLKCKKIIDGKGIFRVAEAIIELIKK